MVQRSGIDTIKYHTWPRIPMGKWQTHRRHHKREPRGQPFPSFPSPLPPPPPPLQWLGHLSILGRWFCCCWSIAYCCSHCLWGFCVWSFFCYSVLCVLLVLQPPLWGKKSRLLYFNRVPDVLWLLVFCRSSSRYPVLIWSMWLWYFLFILICFFEMISNTI